MPRLPLEPGRYGVVGTGLVLAYSTGLCPTGPPRGGSGTVVHLSGVDSCRRGVRWHRGFVQGGRRARHGGVPPQEGILPCVRGCTEHTEKVLLYLPRPPGKTSCRASRLPGVHHNTRPAPAETPHSPTTDPVLSQGLSVAGTYPSLRRDVSALLVHTARDTGRPVGTRSLYGEVT